MRIIMFIIVICMVGAVLSLAFVGGSAKSQIGKGGKLQASLTYMGPH
ncbi:hypothetical protein AB4Z52_11420 [Rhizobium sp. 2YAF20]